MGNQLAPPSKQESWHQGELLHVVVKDTLGGGRFLKSLLCLHDNGGLVVVKVFYKRKDTPSLAPYKQQLAAIRDALLGLQCPHVWPMQTWWETPNAAYMMRQYFFASLYDRLSTRPFLTALEKRWITFQLLQGLSQAHAHGVCHGDIKCENVMVTSWNWLLLADWAAFKPTYLPADNPADFSYYFDSGSRRRCYLAPERFFEGSPAAINAAAPLTPDMDVFSLGCVIAELWLDGAAFFDLSRLLAYRRGEYDPTPALAGVAGDVAELVMHMIQRSPGERWSADQYLTSWPRQLFPPHFGDVLHPLFNGLLGADPDARLAALAAQYDAVAGAICGAAGGADGGLAQGCPPLAAAAPEPAAAGAAGQPPLDHAAAASAALPPPLPGAGSELLAAVDHLLADVGNLQRRLAAKPGGLAAAGEDDGICIDETGTGGSRSDAGAPWSGPGSLLVDEPGRPAGTAAASPSGQQLVTDEWYEHQVRDASNQWVPGSPPGCSSSSKADVALPPGGWQWCGDWALQAAAEAPGACEGGWQYAAAHSDGATRAWAAGCSEQQARYRRRCWVRQRACAAAAAVGQPPGGLLQEAATPQARAGGGCGGQDQGMVLLAVLLCTLLRGSKLQESKRAAIMLLFRCALLCDEQVRLQTVVPYLLTQLSDPSASVRSLALRCVVGVMASLSRLPPADAKVYHDYLLPSLSLLPHDPEESVRVAYALAVAHLAAAAHEHLLGMQYGDTAAQPAAQQQQQQGGGAAAGSGRRSAADDAALATESAAAAAAAVEEALSAALQQQLALPPPPGAQAAQAVPSSSTPAVRYDAEMAAVRMAVEKVVLELVTGTRSSADIKRALLSHAAGLGLFFGRRDINDLLLPLLITCLNAGEWSLRGAFFGAIAGVGPHTGRDSLDVFLLPCLEQALVDSETAVVADAVRCLAAVCGHLRHRSLLAAARKVAPLLRHPSAAVRHSAVAFTAAAARALPAADVFTQLASIVSGHLQMQPLLLTAEEHLAACLAPPAGPGDADDADGAGGLSARPLRHAASASTTGRTSPASSSRPSSSGASSEQQQQQQHAGAGSLVACSAAAAVQRSVSEQPSSSGGRAGLAAAAPSPLAAPCAALSHDGGELMLRPPAPVYIMDLDPAAVGAGGAAAAAAAGQGAADSSDSSGSGRAAAAASGGATSRCGYRLDGFGCSSTSSSGGNGGGGCGSSGAAAPSAAAPGARAGALAAPGLLPAAAAGVPAAPPRAPEGCRRPGEFWPGPCAGIGGAAGAGLLTGMSSSLGVGPGGLVIGTTAAGSSAGLRPRPKSSHTAAVDSIARKQAALQERYQALSEALARDQGLEAGDRQQLDRLATTLHRLRLRPGSDVRCPAALLTYKMAALTSRAGPGAPGGSTGDAAGAGPAVYDAVSAAITTGIGQHLPGASHEGAGAGGPAWRPRGVLVSHLQEHRSAVTCLAASANGALLLSGSEDETVKVWDVRRLERDVSFASRLTYAGQSGRITGVCGVLDGASVASASASGSLHVWRVEYTCKPGGWAPDKYRGVTALRQLSPGEGAILQVVPWGGHPQLLLYASQRGGVHCADLRCAADAWHVPAAPSLGLAQQLVADPSGQHWLAQGTSRGWVCLWDARFLVCVNSWQHPQRCGIDAMSLALASPSRLGLSPSSLPHPGVPLLYIAAGLQEVGLWDILDGQCHQVLRVLNREESQLPNPEPPAALQPPLPAAAGAAGLGKPPGWPGSAGVGQDGAAAAAAGGHLHHHHASGINVSQMASQLTAHLAIDQINSPQARLCGISALLPLPSGALLTGGADRALRYWDASWPERSYVVAGPLWPDDSGIIDPHSHKLVAPQSANGYRYTKRSVGGVAVLEERVTGDARRLVTPDGSPELSRQLRSHELAHADGITRLLGVDGTSRLLASASRDGCIKVWK